MNLFKLTINVVWVVIYITVYNYYGMVALLSLMAAQFVLGLLIGFRKTIASSYDDLCRYLDNRGIL